MSNVTTLLLVSVGNSRSRIAVVRGQGGDSPFAKASLEPSVVVENSTAGALETAITDAASRGRGIDVARTRVLIASVNAAVLPRIASAADGLGLETTRLVSAVGPGEGESVLRVPITAEVEHPGKVGVDRLLCALAASSRSSGQPCAVIDAGTCVTVDLVDGHGVFQGGAIAPGVAMMLNAMHSGTNALPRVAPPLPAPGGSVDASAPASFGLGRSTEQAMLLGSLNAVRGLVRWQVERFAEHLGNYPRIIATGGDAAMLFDPAKAWGGGDELVEHIVPDLQLVGMTSAWSIAHGAELDHTPAEDDTVSED